MNQYKKVILEAAREAGKIITKGFYDLSPTDFKLKAAHDIVTKVDMMANKKIRSIINKNFPTHDILSEETGLEDNESNRFFWTIDPLDGTTNFSIKNPLFCTAISFSKGKNILLSVIYAPLSEELFLAEKGKGAFLNGKKIRVTKNKNLSEVILLISRTHNKKSRKSFYRLLNKFQYETLNARWFGSASLEMAYLSVGRVGACIFTPPDLTKWDLYPGILMVREAGGQVINFKNGEENFSSRGIIAGNAMIIKKIQKDIKKWRI